MSRLWVHMLWWRVMTCGCCVRDYLIRHNEWLLELDLYIDGGPALLRVSRHVSVQDLCATLNHCPILIYIQIREFGVHVSLMFEQWSRIVWNSVLCLCWQWPMTGSPLHRRTTKLSDSGTKEFICNLAASTTTLIGWRGFIRCQWAGIFRRSPIISTTRLQARAQSVEIRLLTNWMNSRQYN